jgi:hypothetical protein
MDGVKGFAAIFEHLLYELLGLLVPGAATVLLIASVWSSTSWNQALAFADRAPWIAIGVAYLVGYVVQGISRPVTSLVELLLRGPVIVGSALLGWGGSKVTETPAWMAGSCLWLSDAKTPARIWASAGGAAGGSARGRTR